MQTRTELTAQKVKTIRALLTDERVKKQLLMAIPKHLSVDRLLRVAITSIQRNPALLECTPQSLLACVMTAAQLGLEPDGITGQAYMVPYRNSKKPGKPMEAQLIPGYRGLLALTRRSGEVRSVQAHVVYSNDRFELRYGLDEKLEHVPADGDRGEPRGAYVIFRYKDGSHSFDYMSREDIEKVRQRSKSPAEGPWATDWDEMAKKTVIRRHAKLAPMSVEFAKAVALEDRFHAGESQMDLLTEGEQVIEPEQPLPEPCFEELVAEAAKGDGAILQQLEKFVAVTAEANGIGPEELKETAARNFEEFWHAFHQWMQK